MLELTVRIPALATVTLGVRLFVAATSALLAVVTSRLLGPADRGVLVISVTAVGLTSLVATLGVNVAGRTALGRHDGQNAIRTYVWLSVTLGVFGAAVSIAVATLALPPAGAALDAVQLGMLSALAFGTLLGVLGLSGLFGTGALMAAAVVESSAAVLQTLVALVATYAYGLSGALAALALGALVQGIAATALLWRRAPQGAACNVRYAKRLLSVGSSGFLYNIGQAAVVRGDRYVLGVLATTATVGVYSVGATLSEILWLLSLAASNYLAASAASGRLTPARLIHIKRAVLAGLSVVAVVIATFAEPIIVFLFGVEFVGAVTPTRILLVAAIAMSAYHLDVTLVLASPFARVLGHVLVVAVLVGLLLNLALVPSLGAAGAATASLIVYLGLAGSSQRLLARLDVRA